MIELKRTALWVPVTVSAIVYRLNERLAQLCSSCIVSQLGCTATAWERTEADQECTGSALKSTACFQDV